MNIHLRDLKENLTYLALWLLLFLTPVVSMVIRVSSNEYLAFDWQSVFRVWKIFAIYLAIFLIHNFILAPLLIYKHKKLMYFATTVALLAVFVVYQCGQKPTRPLSLGTIPQRDMVDRKPEAFPPVLPPEMVFGPDGRQFHDELPQPNGNQEPRRRGEGTGPGRPMGRPPFLMGPADILNTVMVVLLLGMNLGIKLYFKSNRDAEEMQLLERQNLEQQLEYLKYQINPHFFMNTLNNIHALVDIDSEKAKATILELSKLMRYVLYEGANKTVPLKREVDFLHNYVTLMRLRYTDRVKIEVDIPDAVPELSVPPMLFITFVENAFKHGISYKEASFIRMEMRFVDERIHFACANSKHADNDSEHGGVGLANAKKRLELIYGDNYSLDIHDGEKEYTVKLDVHSI